MYYCANLSTTAIHVNMIPLFLFFSNPVLKIIIYRFTKCWFIFYFGLFPALALRMQMEFAAKRQEFDYMK